MKTPIYEDANYAISYTAGNDVLWITFDHAHMTKSDHTTRDGWGEDMLINQGYSVISVKPAHSDWYMRGDWDEFFRSDAFQRIRASKSRVICYGLSMGGTGALIAGTIIEGSSVVCISPQVSPFADVIPEERRFMHLRDELLDCLDSKHVDVSQLTPVCEACHIFYCVDHAVDKKHVDMLTNFDMKDELQMLGQKHIPMSMLLETGVIKQVIKTISERPLNKDDYEAMYDAVLNTPEALVAKASQPDMAWDDKLALLDKCAGIVRQGPRWEKIKVSYFIKQLKHFARQKDAAMVEEVFTHLKKLPFFTLQEKFFSKCLPPLRSAGRQDLIDEAFAIYEADPKADQTLLAGLREEFGAHEVDS